MKNYLVATFAIAVSIAFVGGLNAEDEWLQSSSAVPQKNWHQVSKTSYLDLGDDPESVSRLNKMDFVIDEPEVKRSSSLTCKSPYKKYLIRSFFLGTPTASVYDTPTGLVVSAGAFSEPQIPAKGAIAICLLKDPDTVKGIVSFLK
jgi:hypothetical protein